MRPRPGGPKSPLVHPERYSDVSLWPRCTHCGHPVALAPRDSRGWCPRCRAAERERLRRRAQAVAVRNAQRLAAKELAQRNAPPRACAMCYRPLTGRRPHAKTCSARCRQKLSRRLRKPGLERECPVCYRRFFPYRASAVYCSTRCRQWRWRQDRGLECFLWKHRHELGWPGD
jgi:hypothetical protein